MASSVSSTKHNTKPSQTLSNIEEDRLPNSFDVDSITPVLKPDKHIIRKEDCRILFIMNIDAKFLNKILSVKFGRL